MLLAVLSHYRCFPCHLPLPLPPPPNSGDTLARAGWHPVDISVREEVTGGGPMMRLTREDGQTLAGYVLILAPASVVVLFALALVVLTS